MTLGDSRRSGARAARSVASAAVLAALFAACTYPEFGFGPVDETEPSGGSGGSPSGAGQGGEPPVGGASSAGGNSGSPSSSSGHSAGGGGDGGDGGSGGTPEPTVPCGDPSTECDPGQVCCFHDSTPSLDHCDAAGSCGFSYTEFSCNWHDDCGGGECCATLDSVFGYLISMDCQSPCSGGNTLIMCKANSECGDGTCDDFIDSYPGYKWCE